MLPFIILIIIYTVDIFFIYCIFNNQNLNLWLTKDAELAPGEGVDSAEEVELKGRIMYLEEEFDFKKEPQDLGLYNLNYFITKN